MNWFNRFFNSVWNILFIRPQPPAVIIQPDEQQAHAQRPAQGRYTGPPRNPLRDAFQQIFAPRHGSENQVLYQKVGPEGKVVAKSEAYFREGNGLRSVFQKTLIVTETGAIVAPEKIEGICYECGGFESQPVRCSQCGVVLCPKHALVFRDMNGPAVFCRRHYTNAVLSFDVWAARDQAKPKGQV